MFITFEGIEGSGKSTHLRHLAEHLRASGRRVLETREPGGTAAGAAIRRLLLGPDAAPLTPLAELFLYCADRTQPVGEALRRALDAGEIVLCDRFSDSALAYQGYARGLDLEAVRALDARARGGVWPGLTFLLDCPVADGLARARGRPGPGDRFEREALAFHERVPQGLLTLPAAQPEPFSVLHPAEPTEPVPARATAPARRWPASPPVSAARKGAVLGDRRCLRGQAQNALLKTLEEPPGAAVLVLVAPSAALLLPTVRSRCQVVRLEPLPAAEVVRVLEASGVPAEQASQLAPLAEGSPGRALALAGEAEKRARALVLRDPPRLRELDADELSTTAQELARGALDAGLATALAWYRDVLETALAGDGAALRNPAAADDVRRAARRLSAAALLRQLEAVYDTIVAPQKDANRMLAVETMLLSLRAIERGASAGAPPWKSTR